LSPSFCSSPRAALPQLLACSLSLLLFPRGLCWTLSCAAVGAAAQRRDPFVDGCSSSSGVPAGPVLDCRRMGFLRNLAEMLLGRLGNPSVMLAAADFAAAAGVAAGTRPSWIFWSSEPCPPSDLYRFSGPLLSSLLLPLIR